MHVGLVMECDYRDGRTQEEAFAEAFSIVDIAEAQGIDGVWLAERHFAGPRRPTDPMGGGIPSIASVPLVLAAAIAARTKRVRIGTGVSVLPLCHPVRLAEEAATVDQISKGRLDFGVGRSGFPRAYAGYGVPYGESRERPLLLRVRRRESRSCPSRLPRQRCKSPAVSLQPTAGRVHCRLFLI